jgi:hypothetical protein
MIEKRQWILECLIGTGIAVSASFFLIDQGLAKPWTLEPRLTVSARYDDNILSVEDNTESDRVMTISPGLSLNYGGKRIRMGADYEAIIERFSDRSDLNNVGHAGSVAFTDGQLFGSKKTSFLFRDTFQFTPQLQGALSAPGLPPAGAGVGLPRNNTWLNTAVLGLTRLSTARLRERIEYINSLIRFEDPTLFDSTTHEGNLEAEYQLSPNNDLTGGYRLQYFNFVQEEADDGLDHIFFLELAHRYSPSVSLTVRLGPSYSIQSGTSFVTPVGLVRLSNLTEKLAINAEYSRDISTIAGISTQLVVVQTVSSDLFYSVTKELKVVLDASVSDSEAFIGEELKIIYWNVRAGLSYQILKWLFAEIRYNHIEQYAKGSNAGNDFVQNQYIIGLTGRFPWNFGGQIE